MKGTYIKKIEIDSLWSGKRHVEWKLRPDVNILSGVNGMGKSTILNRVVKTLLSVSTLEREMNGVKLSFEPSGSTEVDFDVVRSFDRPVVSSELLGRVADVKLHTELDFALYQLQRRYLDYQVNVSNRMVELFTSADPEAQTKAAAIAGEKTHFQDLVDELFRETGKAIMRDRNEIVFRQWDEEVQPYMLSSGEKQMLIILLTVLVQDKRQCVLFMDEPEVSLHVEWQERLISIIREMNPNVQIILTTHSPAVIMNGWMDAVTDVADIIK